MPKPDAFDAVLADLGDSMTVPEVAELLSVHPATIYRAIKSGRLKASSRGSGRVRRTLTRVSRAAVVEFLNDAAPDPAASEAA